MKRIYWIWILTPKTIDHSCECSCHGDTEMEIRYDNIYERVESTDCALEECSSDRMGEGGMMGWVEVGKKKMF